MGLTGDRVPAGGPGGLHPGAPGSGPRARDLREVPRRAAATIDREQDRADRVGGRRIVCPLLALWSARGPLASGYVDESGPIALWRDWSDAARGGSLDVGHFFPEEAPEVTAEALSRFFGG
jgi:haloacetate dehalogenase